MWRRLAEQSGRLERGGLGLLKKLVLLPGSFRLCRCELDIRDQEWTIGVRGAYIGEGLSLPYYRKLYRSPALPAGRIPIWGLRRWLREARSTCAVVLVELNPLLAFLLPKDGWTADSWVRQETILAGEPYLRRARGIERGWGQKVRRQAYRYCFSRDKEAMEEFYREFYVPYLRERHGERAVIRSLPDLKAALRSGFLLQVWRGAEWVAGLVASYDNHGRVRLLASGAKSAQWLQRGALSAAYYFVFQWARENEFQTVDFCGTRPHLMDGVFQHKALWAAEPRHDPWHHTRIVFYVASDASLPRVVTQQLVRQAGSFVSIEACLSKGLTG